MTTAFASLSIVIPVYGCRDALEQLINRLSNVVSQLECSFEILLIDDSSLDGGWQEIQRLSLRHNFIKGIQLSRNFGQHVAIMAGLRQSSGEVVVVMDCDLQDPPEMIPTLLGGLATAPVSIAIRMGRHQSFSRRIQARLFRQVLEASSGMKLTRELTSFAALKRVVVDQYVKFSEPDQHFLHILNWLGFARTEIQYDRPARISGKSAYSFKSRLKHAARGLFFETSRILYLIAFAGLLIATGGFLGAIFVLVRATGGNSLSGWPSTICAIVFFGGASMVVQSTVGIYVARTFQLSKRRPLYIVGETVNLDREIFESQPTVH